MRPSSVPAVGMVGKVYIVFQTNRGPTSLFSVYNLAGVHARYMHVLSICKRQADQPFAEALREAKVARNTIRDFLGLAELKILDERKYEEAGVRWEVEKSSVKQFERVCRLEVLKYFDELNEKKSNKNITSIHDPKIVL